MKSKFKAYQTEQQLWQAFLAGNKSAYAQLFDEYVDAMYAYGRKMSTDGELVKDAIQDVFVKLYNNRSNLNETTSIKGYLFVALKRTLINLFDDKRIMPIDSESVLFEIELLSETTFKEEQELYDDAIKTKLEQALRELTSRQREAIYLYYIQEIPLTEIPDLLGMNYQSTRNLLHRAMTKLRVQLGSLSASSSVSLLLLHYLSK